MADAELQLKLLPTDDLMHENSGEENFNESAYYNFYDPRGRVGGFVRLGNRPNEGYAEMTTCFYLPDGRVAFMFKRPEISANAGTMPAACDSRCASRSSSITSRYRGHACMLARSARDGRSEGGVRQPTRSCRSSSTFASSASRLATAASSAAATATAG